MAMAKRRLVGLCGLGVVVALTGCIERDLGQLEPKVGRVIDQPVTSEGATAVDLMLVIDNSGSMDEEQDLLEREIPALVRGLTSPPDSDGDGAPDWNAVESLRVAIVTSDLGTTGEPVGGLSGCGIQAPSMNPWGDDGALQSDVACDPTASGIQAWEAGDDVDAFVDRVSCIAALGTNGCGFEQPLAAAARALSRRAETGFPRPDALLAVLVLTDEEDCSVANTGVFYGAVPSTGREINRYCVHNADLLASADALARELTVDRDASRFVFAAIAGVPVDLVDRDFATILADDRMRYVDDDTAMTGLRYTCTALNADGSLRSQATPGRRIVELADRIPGALVRSICEDDFSPAIAELTRRIGARITDVCLGRALTPDAEGRVDCVVEETLPVGLSCASVPGRVSIGVGADGRELCDIEQAPNGMGSGWYYDLVDTTCDKITFTPDALPPFGARVRFHCIVEVPGDERPVPVGP